MNSIKSSLVKVFASNFLVLAIGVFNGFIVPKFLGVSEYSVLKTFTLYSSYVVLLQFGFTTGLYIKYGGEKLEVISKPQIKSEFTFLVLIMLPSTIIILVIGIIINNLSIIGMALMAYPVNIVAFYKLFFQALGEFDRYSKINSIYPVLRLLAALILVFVLRVKDSKFFILAEVLVSYLFMSITIYIQKNFIINVKSNKIFNSEKFGIMKVGFIIMLGSFSNMLFYSMDRWFVKVFLSSEKFAYYSFAVSMMNIVMILITSVSMTFYPMLVRRQREELLVKKLKNYLLILGAFSSSAYFLFDIIVKLILKDYIPSLEVVAILFAGFPSIAVINAIYVNLYKAQKNEKKYFFTVLGMVAISLGLNALAVLLKKSNLTIALATTIAFYFWFFYSSKDFKGTKTNKRELLYLVLFLCIFFSTTRLLTWYIGFPLYILSMLSITLIFYKKEFIELISKIFNSFIRKKGIE